MKFTRQQMLRFTFLAFFIVWAEIYLLKFLFPISVQTQEFSLTQASQIEVAKNRRNQFVSLNIMQNNDKISFNCGYFSQNLCERFFQQNAQVLQGKYLKITPQTKSLLYPSDETQAVFLTAKFVDKNGQIIDYQTKSNLVERATKKVQNHRFSDTFFMSLLSILCLSNIFRVFQK